MKSEPYMKYQNDDAGVLQLTFKYLNSIEINAMRRLICLLTLSLVSSTTLAGQVTISSDRTTGVQVYVIKQGMTTVKLAPSRGANVFSINVAGTEYLRQPDSLDNLFGTRYGNPILYPTPNRIRGAQFNFEGTTVKFKPNARGNHIHGLVNQTEWQVAGTNVNGDAVSVRCLASFAPGTELHKQFPFAHRLYVMITVKKHPFGGPTKLTTPTARRESLLDLRCTHTFYTWGNVQTPS